MAESPFDVSNPGMKGSNAFWEKEREWQLNALSSRFDVTVSDPQKVSQTFGKSYTEYLVSCVTDTNTFEVRRRFSDFDWLRGVLMGRFHGVSIPVLPEKRLVGNQEAGFIEERRRGLEKWVADVVANPYLKLDSTLRMFLRTSDKGEFEQHKKAVSTGAGGDPAENEGLARWFGVLRTYNLPADYNAALEEVENDCDAARSALGHVVAACSEYWDASKRFSESLNSMRDSLDDWRSLSDRTANTMSSALSAASVATRETSSVVGKTMRAFSEAADLAAFSPSEVQMFLVTALSTELRRVKAMRDLLDVLKRARVAYQDAFKNQDSLQYKAKNLRSKNKADQANALEPKIAAAVRLTQRMKERVEDIAKGILNVEAAKVARARLSNITSTFGQFAALGIASGERAQQLWQVLMNDLDLDKQSMEARAQATLTLNPVPEDYGGLPGPTPHSNPDAGSTTASNQHQPSTSGAAEIDDDEPAYTGTSYGAKRDSDASDKNTNTTSKKEESSTEVFDAPASHQNSNGDEMFNEANEADTTTATQQINDVSLDDEDDSNDNFTTPPAIADDQPSSSSPTPEQHNDGQVKNEDEHAAAFGETPDF